MEFTGEGGGCFYLVAPYTYTLLPNGTKFLVPWYLTPDRCTAVDLDNTLGFYCMDVGGMYHFMASHARSLCDN